MSTKKRLKIVIHRIFPILKSKSLESLHLSQATWFIKTEFILVSPYLIDSCVSLVFSQVLLSFVRNSLTPYYARSKRHLYPLLMTSEDTLNWAILSVDGTSADTRAHVRCKQVMTSLALTSYFVCLGETKEIILAGVFPFLVPDTWFHKWPIFNERFFLERETLKQL